MFCWSYGLLAFIMFRTDPSRNRISSPYWPWRWLLRTVVYSELSAAVRWNLSVIQRRRRSYWSLHSSQHRPGADALRGRRRHVPDSQDASRPATVHGSEWGRSRTQLSRTLSACCRVPAVSALPRPFRCSLCRFTLSSINSLSRNILRYWPPAKRRGI